MRHGASRNHLRCRGFHDPNELGADDSGPGSRSRCALRGGVSPGRARPRRPTPRRSATRPARPARRRTWRSCATQQNALQKRPNVIVIDTDDMNAARHLRDAQHAQPAGRPRHDLPQQLRLLSALLPVPGDLPDRAVRAQPRRPHRPALRRSRQLEHARGLAAAGQVPDRDGRQVPERLRRHGPVARDPAGLDPVVRAHRRHRAAPLRLQAQRERQGPALRHGSRATTSTTSSTPRSTRC